jgi:hypothetical protein
MIKELQNLLFFSKLKIITSLNLFNQMEPRCGLCQGRYYASDEPVYSHPDFVSCISMDCQIHFILSGNPILCSDVDTTQVFAEVLILAKRIGSIGRIFGSKIG